jgi:hypothetical protein
MNPDKLLERINRATDGTADDPRAGSFARGMVLGALVGAAIAGSTIWQRRQARLAAEDAELAGPAEPVVETKQAE